MNSLFLYLPFSLSISLSHPLCSSLSLPSSIPPTPSPSVCPLLSLSLSSHLSPPLSRTWSIRNGFYPYCNVYWLLLIDFAAFFPPDQVPVMLCRASSALKAKTCCILVITSTETSSNPRRSAAGEPSSLFRNSPRSCLCGQINNSSTRNYRSSTVHWGMSTGIERK